MNKLLIFTTFAILLLGTGFYYFYYSVRLKKDLIVTQEEEIGEETPFIEKEQEKGKGNKEKPDPKKAKEEEPEKKNEEEKELSLYVRRCNDVDFAIIGILLLFCIAVCI